MAAARGAVAVAGVAVLASHVAALVTLGPHTQDGPPHLWAATALRDLLGGADGTLADVYAPNVAAGWTNLTTYPPLVALSAVLGAEAAERVVVALLVTGVAAALAWAAAAFGRGAGVLAAAGLPLAVGWSVHTGLYNFTAGTALALVAVGLHRRVDGRTDRVAAVGVAALLVVVAVSHPMALVWAYAGISTTWLAGECERQRAGGRAWNTTVAIVRRRRAARPVLRRAGILAAIVAVVRRRRAARPVFRRAGILAAIVAVVRRRRAARPVLRRAGILAATVAPSAVPLAAFLLDADAVRPRPVARDPWTALADAVLLRWQVGAVGPDDAGWTTVLAVALWAAVAVLAGRRIVVRDGWRGHDLWAVQALVLGGAAVLVPDRLAGGTLVQPRVALLAVVALLLWVAGADRRGARWPVVAVAAAGVVAGAGLLHARLEPYRAIDAAAAEVVSVAPQVRPGALVLGAVAARSPAGEATVPLVHAVDRLALRAGAVPALTLDAGSGYGPVRYRARFDPLPALRGFPRNRLHGTDLAPAALAAITARYAETTGRPLDHLVLVGYDLSATDRAALAAAGFDLRDRSEPTGLVWLYDVPAGAAP